MSEGFRVVYCRFGGGKVIENIAKKFRRSVIKWMDLIDNSFLADDLKKQYKRLILKRLLLLR
jgi:serine/threonine-protein kinase HipA